MFLTGQPLNPHGRDRPLVLASSFQRTRQTPLTCPPPLVWRVQKYNLFRYPQSLFSRIFQSALQNTESQHENFSTENRKQRKKQLKTAKNRREQQKIGGNRQIRPKTKSSPPPCVHLLIYRPLFNASASRNCIPFHISSVGQQNLTGIQFYNQPHLRFPRRG